MCPQEMFVAQGKSRTNKEVLECKERRRHFSIMSYVEKSI
jgi:hypothetical protein